MPCFSVFTGRVKKESVFSHLTERPSAFYNINEYPPVLTGEGFIPSKPGCEVGEHRRLDVVRGFSFAKLDTSTYQYHIGGERR